MQPIHQEGMMGAEETDSHALSEEAIETALEAVRARIEKAEGDRAGLDRAIAAAREEERLLQRLLALRRDGPAERELEQQEAREAAGDDRPISPTAFRRKKYPAVQAVIDELATAGRPLHISELMRLLRTRDVPIPGSGTQANLITHLRRDSRLVRTSRGMYGLAAWGLESMQPARRIRRRRKRRRTTATS